MLGWSLSGGRAHVEMAHEQDVLMAEHSWVGRAKRRTPSARSWAS